MTGIGQFVGAVLAVAFVAAVISGVMIVTLAATSLLSGVVERKNLRDMAAVEAEVADRERTLCTHSPLALSFESEYQNAPTGTIAAEDQGYPYIKHPHGYWIGMRGEKVGSENLAGIERQVLRFGSSKAR